MKNARCLISGQKKINISVVVFFWKYDVKTRCKNFNLLPLFEKNNGMVINKKNLLLERIKNCVENTPESVTAQHGWQMLYSRRKVCHIYSAASFWKIILRSIKTRQRNGHKLCSFMHFNCNARQSATKNVFLQGHRQLQTAKGIPYRAIIKKSTFCFQSGVEIHDVCLQKDIF